MLKKTLSVSLPFVLAALASAQSEARAESRITATYTADAGVALTGVLYEDHMGLVLDDHSVVDQTREVYEGGRAFGSYDSGVSSSHVAGTNVFELGATAHTYLHSNDYAEIQDYAEVYTFRASAYYLSFTNNGAADATVSFAMEFTAHLYGSAASPFGLQTFDANYNNLTYGAWSQGDAYKGVTDVTGGWGNGAALGDAESYYGNSADNTGAPVEPVYDYTFTGSFAPTSTFTLKPGETRQYRVFASVDAWSHYLAAPVPEPAAFLPLGLGALALLRRRARRA